MLIKSDSLDKILPAFISAQGAIKVAIKDSTNPHFKRRYADLVSVWSAAKDALQANRLGVMQLPSTLEDGSIALTTMLCHDSGQYIASTYRLKPAKEDPQGYGSALTYARRYGLAALLGIVADDDDDANHASQPAQKTQPVQAAPKPGPATQAAKDMLEKQFGAPATVISTAWNPEDPEHQKMFMAAVSACGYDPAEFKNRKLWYPFLKYCTGIDRFDASVANLQTILFPWLKEMMK